MTEALQENVYVPLKPKSFTIGHDKFLTLLELQKNKVPIPTTYLALTVESAKKVLPKIKFPVIMKIPAGTQGKGVMFADSIESANTILDTLEIFKQPFIIQEYIETGATDIRAIVANNKVIAAMKRKATKEELRANIHMGATGEPYIPSYDTEQIIIKAAKALNTEICAVDLLEDLTPKVIEVNTSPGLVGISKATKKNIFRLVAEALYEGTKTFKEYKKSKDYNQVIKEISNRKDIITNLEIKAGKIRLPGVLTKITGFNDEEEVILKVEKNKVTIEKHDM
jgi:ribosomal protein S6--L-glutamate ligase